MVQTRLENKPSMQLHYQTLGQGQAIIFIHGLFGSSDNWGSVAKYFAQTYQVISVDLRNHAKSPHSDLQSYAEMAQDIAELCQSLNLGAVHIIGHSLGGKVAMQFATQFPEYMGQLVVVDMAIRDYPDEHTQLIDAMLSVDVSTMPNRSAVDKALSGSIPNDMVRQFLLMNLIKVDRGLAWRINLPALKANYPNMQQAVCENVLYEKPCLFIRGSNSDYVQDHDLDHIKTHFVNAQFSSLPAGHWVHAEQPQAFIGVLSKFLTS